MKIQFLGLIALFFFTQASQATPLCVVSLLPETNWNELLPEKIDERLEDMGHNISQENTYYEFKGNLVGLKQVYSSIKECIEGDFEEVAIVTHTSKNLINQAVIVYPKSISAEGDKYEIGFLDNRFLNTLKPGENLRQISLIGCDSESLRISMPNFFEIMEARGIRFKEGPVNPFLSWIQGVDNGRSVVDAIEILAESAQPRNSRHLFCFPNFQTNKIYSCLAGRILIENPNLNSDIGKWLVISRGSAASEPLANILMRGKMKNHRAVYKGNPSEINYRGLGIYIDL